MKTTNAPVRRLTMVSIILIEFTVSIYTASLLLPLLEYQFVAKFQALIAILIVDLFWMIMIVGIYKPMNSLLKDLLNNLYSLTSKKALTFYVMVAFFGFGGSIVFISSFGLLIYIALGG